MRCPSAVLLTLCLLALCRIATPAVTASGQAGLLSAGAPTFEQGYAHLQAGRVDDAIAVLRAFVELQPDHGHAWAVLGYALHSQKRWDEALPCHERAADLPGSAGMGAYNAGLLHAVTGDIDAAFSWLERAAASGTVDMSQLADDPEAAALRDDPRFAALLPSFDDPFVEGATVLHEWVGEAPGGEFGWIARNCGDVDGDRLADVVTSAPSLAVSGPQCGTIYVYATGTGELLWKRSGAPGDRLGVGIEAAGDVDGDGTPDVIASAPGGNYVLMLAGRDGRLIHRIDAPQPGENFGRKVSDVGDVDGDGHDDVFVGAPDHDTDLVDVGRAYVYSGKDARLLGHWTGSGAGHKFGSSGAGAVTSQGPLFAVGAPGAGAALGGQTLVFRGFAPEPAFVISADAGGKQLGAMFVSIVGDVDGDGQPDVYASDWSHGQGEGRIYVHSGATGERVLAISGTTRGEGFGIGSADLGDLDGDGHDDLVVGSWQYAAAARSGGRVAIHSGKDGSLLHAWTGKLADETFGFDATGIGDLNGDGVIDVVLTSAWSGKGGAKTGRVWVLAGPRRAGDAGHGEDH